MENSATWAWGMFPTNLEAALPQHTAHQEGQGIQVGSIPENEAGQAVVKIVEGDTSKDDGDPTGGDFTRLSCVAINQPKMFTFLLRCKKISSFET